MDIKTLTLAGHLLHLDAQYQPSPEMAAHARATRPEQTPTVRFNVTTIRNVVPSTVQTQIPESGNRSRHRWDFSFNYARPELAQTIEFDPFGTYYHGVTFKAGYFHTLWGQGSFWEGSIGAQARLSVVFGSYQNNGSHVVGGSLCAAVRQSISNYFSLDAYVCPELAYSQLSFGRAGERPEHMQPSSSNDFNIALGLEGTAHLSRRNRYAPGIFGGVWQTWNVSGTSTVVGTPVNYQIFSGVLGVRFFLDPATPHIPRDPDEIVVRRANERVEAAERNYANLLSAVDIGYPGRPTRAQYAESVREVNALELARCESTHLQTLSLNHRPPAPRYSFVFSPGSSAIPTRQVNVFLAQGVPQPRNAELDRIATELSRTERTYYVVDAYAVDRRTSDENITLSRQRLAAVRSYFATFYPGLLSNDSVASHFVFDDQSAHGQDVPLGVSGATNPAVETQFYLNNAVTFTVSTEPRRADCECVQDTAPAGARDPDEAVRLHTNYLCR